jgi:hypothetical protein
MMKRISSQVFTVLAFVAIGVFIGSLWASQPMMEDDDEKEISLTDLPTAVKEIILKEAGGNAIQEVEEQTKNGVKFYEAEWLEGDLEVEVEVVYLCKLYAKEVEPAEGEEEEDDDDITEVSETEVDLSQVPEVVRTAILKEAGTNKVKEVEEITASNGNTYYEAEWILEGYEVELLLDAKGSLVCKRMEWMHGDDDDDGDDDGDDGDDDDDDDHDDDDDDD